MSKTKLAEAGEGADARFPLMLYRTRDDYRVAESDEQADALALDGYMRLDDLPPEPVAGGNAEGAATSPDRERLMELETDLSNANTRADTAEADLKAANDLIAEQNDAGQRIATERDGLKAQVEALTAELTAAKAEIAKVDPDGDGKVGGSAKKS